MRYNHLLAVPLAAGLLTSVASLAMAVPSSVTVVPTKLGFTAQAAAPAAVPSYALLAYDDSPGSVDKQGRVERAERDRGDRGDVHDNMPNRPHR